MKYKAKDYSIGEMSKFYGMSQDTIRLYDKKGILSPYKREENAYRTYSREDFVTMDYVMRMKKLNLSLEEVREILNEDSIEDIRELIAKQEERIKQQIKNLKLVKNLIDDYKGSLDASIRDIRGESEVQVRNAPPFIVKEIETTMEEAMNDFYELEPEQMPFLTIEYKYDSSLTSDDVKDRFIREKILDYKVSLLDYNRISESPTFPREKFRVIPPKNYVYTIKCIYTNQDYSGFQCAYEYMEKHNYKIAGDPIYRLVAFTNNTHEGREYFELWIPIEEG